MLRWDERGDGEHATMLAWYRALIAARHAYPALRDPGAEATRATECDGIFSVERGELSVVCNLTEQAQPVSLGEVLLASQALANSRELPPLACAVVRRLG